MGVLDASEYLAPPHQLSLKAGEDFAIEEQAAAWLAESRRGVTALSAKRDYLTKDQLALRYQREVMNGTGLADESLYHGMFRRAHNSLAGTRPKRMRSAEEW